MAQRKTTTEEVKSEAPTEGAPLANDPPLDRVGEAMTSLQALIDDGSLTRDAIADAIGLNDGGNAIGSRTMTPEEMAAADEQHRKWLARDHDRRIMHLASQLPLTDSMITAVCGGPPRLGYGSDSRRNHLGAISQLRIDMARDMLSQLNLHPSDF